MKPARSLRFSPIEGKKKTFKPVTSQPGRITCVPLLPSFVLVIPEGLWVGGKGFVTYNMQK